MILDILQHLRMRLNDSAELTFPIAIQHGPVHVTLFHVRLPAIFFAGREVNEVGRTFRVVGIHDHLDRIRPLQ